MKLLLTLLVCVIVAPLPALSRARHKCGKHFCVWDANCIDERCVCKSGKGSGYFFCRIDDFEACMLIGDPHFDNYNGEKGLFPIPCRHRLTHMLETASGCQVEVFGITKLEQAKRAYEVGIEVNVKVGDEILKIILDSDKDTYFYVQDGHKSKMNKNRGYNVNLGGVIVTIMNGEIVIMVDTNYGHFAVWFTPPLNDFGQTPGVLVWNRKNTATFNYTNSRFPDSLCSVPGELNAMVEYQQRNNLDSTNLAVIHAWLTSGVGQESNKQCQDMMDHFGDVCTTKKMKSDAVNICGPMFDDRNRGCFNREGKIIPDFITCVKAVCSPDSNKLCTYAKSLKNTACELKTLQERCASINFP